MVSSKFYDLGLCNTEFLHHPSVCNTLIMNFKALRWLKFVQNFGTVAL